MIRFRERKFCTKKKADFKSDLSWKGLLLVEINYRKDTEKYFTPVKYRNRDEINEMIF